MLYYSSRDAFEDGNRKYDETLGVLLHDYNTCMDLSLSPHTVCWPLWTISPLNMHSSVSLAGPGP